MRTLSPSRRTSGMLLLALLPLAVASLSCGRAPRPSQVSGAGAAPVSSESYLRDAWNIRRADPGQPFLLGPQAGIVDTTLSTLRSAGPINGLHTAVVADPKEGWRSSKPSVESPALYTAECLQAVRSKDLATAEKYARFMLDHLVQKNGAGSGISTQTEP